LASIELGPQRFNKKNFGLFEKDFLKQGCFSVNDLKNKIRIIVSNEKISELQLFKGCYLPQLVCMHTASCAPSACPISHEAAQN